MSLRLGSGVQRLECQAGALNFDSVPSGENCNITGPVLETEEWRRCSDILHVMNAGTSADWLGYVVDRNREAFPFSKRELGLLSSSAFPTD